MGVNGLWRLLMPIGRRISVETLTNKTLAIDASIWLTQFLKAMRDPITGQTKPSAHLIGFIRRICKLLYFGIKPVFVFDGPTPQIKLREIRARRQRRERGTLFAGEDIAGDDLAIKKLARRILLQQIQAAKAQQNNGNKKNVKSLTKNNAISSFADDFNLDPDESTPEKEGKLETKSEQEDKNITKSEEIKKDDQIHNTIDLSASTSGKNEWNEIDELQNHQNNVKGVNDFDKPISIDSDSDQSDNPVHKDRKYTYQNYNTSINIPSDHSDLDEDALINMPSRMRTDIFENVLKQQRMKSRQEFMPVAANPDAYSQVQLKNFLKQSHLNQKINRIVTTRIVDNEQDQDSNGNKKNQDFEMGEHIASDPSTRFIYTKDSDDENTKAKQPQQRNRLKRKRELYSNNSQNSDDEDDHFFQSNSKNESDNILSAGNKSNQFQDSDGVTDDTDEEGGFMADDESISEKIVSKENTDGESKDNKGFVDVHVDSDDDEGGGFIAYNENEESNRNSKSLQSESKKSEVAKQILQDEMLARAIEKVEEEGKNEGGFIQQYHNDEKEKQNSFISKKSAYEDISKDKNEINSPIMIDEFDTNSKDDFDEIYAATHRSDSDDVQSMESETKSSTEMEVKMANKAPLKKEKLLEFFSQFGGSNNSDSDSDIMSQNKDEMKGIESNKEKQYDEQQNKNTITVPEELDESDSSECQVIGVLQRSENKSETATDSVNSSGKHYNSESDLDSDSEQINWEDGNEESDSEDQNQKTNINAQIESTSNTKSGEKGTKAPLSSRTDGLLNKVDVNEEISLIQGDKTSKHDSMQKDDDGDSLSSMLSTTPSKIVAFARKGEDIEINDNDITISLDESKESTKMNYELKSKDDFSLVDNFSKSDAVSDSNEAALLHAHKTASNLADWAGRAFRRALAGHIDVKKLSNDKSSPNSKTEKNDDVQDEGSDSSEESIESSKESTKNEVKFMKDKTKQSSPKDGVTKTENFESKSYDSSKFVQGSDTQQALFNTSNEKMNQLSDEKDLLDEEMKRHERDLATVTDEMKNEIIQLLHIFGIPYVESPSEAEAQCVALEELGLVDGIVTEDSDVFVFGGKNIYKNIFDDKKYVEIYFANDAERELALSKNDMIALAMLLGGDYTEGVKGVGIVNGMEILQAFPVYNGVREGLLEFKKWLEGFDPIIDMNGSKGGKIERKKASTKIEKFHVKHRTARTRWIAPKSFPAPNVLNAYSRPVVDKSEVKFSWGVPDLDEARVFCQKLIGWRHDETDKIIVPVLREMAKSSRQTKLESYFMSYRDNIKFADVRSKRLQKVMKDIQSKKKQEKDSHQQNITVKTEIQSNKTIEKKESKTNKNKRPRMVVSKSVREGQTTEMKAESKVKDEERGNMDDSVFTLI